VALPAEALATGMEKLHVVSTAVLTCVAENSEPFNKEKMEAAIQKSGV
jgi:hypothetical protein